MPSSPVKQSAPPRHRSKSCITQKRIQKSSKINLQDLADGLQDSLVQIQMQKQLLKSPIKKPPKTPLKTSTQMSPKSPAKRRLFQNEIIFDTVIKK